ncbi:MAG: His/Gly/Thr/Pro-type tRNA ligase C-terminal domain-containing protein, partial [Chloroflexota bacterium]
VQDDAHIFCSVDQIEQEISAFLQMLDETYRMFKFDDARFALSLRPDKRIGSDDIWDRAETALGDVLERRGLNFERMEGEGAFYGPKIDVFVPDALNREWQLGTVQLDFSLPERFDLEYAADDGTRQRPVVIHRAMLGSVERFLGVLIEHLAGAFPVWLAPVQARLIPIADRHVEYSERVREQLARAGVRVDVDASNERMNAKIRNAQREKVPYMLVVGDREIEGEQVAVRTRSGGNLGAVALSAFQEQITQEIRERS